MTMRLDIVTNDAGELVRREHARELGGGVVIAIYRLTKLAQMHDLNNQAFVRQLDQAHQLIGEYCLRSGSNVNVLFADKATFVAGQLLKGSRGAYEAAAELGALLERLGGSELHVARDVTREDLNVFAEQISLFHRTGSATQIRMPPKIHLRRVADAARLRGIELEDLSADQRIVRAYASAVVIMRRFFEDLGASRYVLPRRIKRIAQSLVDLSDASTASFLGVTEVRNANYDEAGRAVNTAVLAVSIARESTQDRTILAQIAMAAMMHDVARPRALAIAGSMGSPMPGMAGPTTLSEDQEDRLAAGAAAVLTALGRVNEPSITRTVVTFEALWLRRKTWLGPVYWGARAPTMHATIIAVARRYNDLLTPEPGLAPPTTDYAVAMLANELTDPQDRTALRMLVSALGLLPTGTVVQLSTGEVAEVVRGARGLGDKPRVRLLSDANGNPFTEVHEFELAQDPHRTIHRVLSIDGWRKGLENGPQAGEWLDSDGDVLVSVPPTAIGVSPEISGAPMLGSPSALDEPARARSDRPSHHDDRHAAWGNSNSMSLELDDAGSDPANDNPSSRSMPSLGSSPSAVAEAMGRMLTDSIPPAPRSETERPDRTVVQADPVDVHVRRTSPSSREPTARGNLAATPLPHVLVYMLDHMLTGSVVFEGTNLAGDGFGDDTIYFVSGIPAKVRLGANVALLGSVLVEQGAIDEAAVEQAVDGAKQLGILLGEYLVGHGIVPRDTVAQALETQLLRKIAYVANLAPSIEYAYYRDVDLLDGWAGEVAVRHPLDPILAGVREWADRARVRATLNRIGKHDLTIHPESDLSRLSVSPEEQTVLDVIGSENLVLSELLERRLADDEVVSSLIYTLAVTRQFAFKGQKKGPMAARDSSSWSELPPRAGDAASSADPSSSMVSGARPAIPMPVTAASENARAPAGVQATARAAGPAGPPPPPMRAPSPSSAGRGLPLPIRPAVPGVRPPGPQIRPISGKKPTMVGLQPGAPPELRTRPPATAAGLPPSDARPTARAMPAVKDVAIKRAAPPLPGGPVRGKMPLSPPNSARGSVSDGADEPASSDSAPLASRSGAIGGSPLASSPRSLAQQPPPRASVTNEVTSGGPTGASSLARPNVTRGNSPARPATSPGSRPNAGAAPPPAKPAVAAPPPSRVATGSHPRPVIGKASGGGAAPVKPAPSPGKGFAPSTGAKSGARASDDVFSDTTKKRSPLMSVTNETSSGGAIEIGDDGLADAEAALEAMSSFRLAEEALARDDLAAAEEHARSAVVSDPSHADYATLLAWIRALGGSGKVVEDAIRTLSKVLIEDPSNERALFYRGKLLVRTNRLPEALNDFNELLAANPHHPEALHEVRQLKVRVP